MRAFQAFAASCGVSKKPHRHRTDRALAVADYLSSFTHPSPFLDPFRYSKQAFTFIGFW